MATVTDGVNTTLLHRPTEQDPFEEVITVSFKETVYPLFFTFDNKNIYAVSNLNRDKTAIVIFDLEKKAESGKPIFLHDQVDAGGLNFSRKRKVLTSVTYTTDKRQVKILDPETDKMYTRMRTAFPDYEISISSANKNEDRFIVRTYSDRSLGS